MYSFQAPLLFPKYELEKQHNKEKYPTLFVFSVAFESGISGATFSGHVEFRHRHVGISDTRSSLLITFTHGMWNEGTIIPLF